MMKSMLGLMEDGGDRKRAAERARFHPYLVGGGVARDEDTYDGQQQPYSSFPETCYTSSYTPATTPHYSFPNVEQPYSVAAYSPTSSHSPSAFFPPPAPHQPHVYTYPHTIDIPSSPVSTSTIDDCAHQLVSFQSLAPQLVQGHVESRAGYEQIYEGAEEGDELLGEFGTSDSTVQAPSATGFGRYSYDRKRGVVVGGGLDDSEARNNAARNEVRVDFGADEGDGKGGGGSYVDYAEEEDDAFFEEPARLFDAGSTLEDACGGMAQGHCGYEEGGREKESYIEGLYGGGEGARAIEQGEGEDRKPVLPPSPAPSSTYLPPPILLAKPSNSQPKRPRPVDSLSATPTTPPKPTLRRPKSHPYPNPYSHTTDPASPLSLPSTNYLSLSPNLPKISPITGLPVKAIARRAYPPKDVAKRKYHCNFEGCGSSFGRPSALESHKRSHDGSKPAFVCPITPCGRGFSVFSNLKRHMIVHPGVDFRGISVKDYPNLRYDDSEDPPLFWIERSWTTLPGVVVATGDGVGAGGGDVSGRRLYVGHLSPDATRQNIEEFFGQNGGQIVDVRMMQGFCFLEYGELKDAESAVQEYNGRDFMNDRLIVEFAKPPRNVDPDRYRPPPRQGGGGHRLQVNNIPEGMSWQDLKDFARQAGTVTFADVDRNQPGVGYIEYPSRSDADEAIRTLSNTEVRGQTITIEDASQS
ncbi:splicing factor, arginine/serine-rich 4 [Pseudohyphozyma bogoriensis]|nr:splicing factor, arginine/serine-rich 4 [Pseudohyphozyma bogoriensis]